MICVREGQESTTETVVVCHDKKSIHNGKNKTDKKKVKKRV